MKWGLLKESSPYWSVLLTQPFTYSELLSTEIGRFREQTVLTLRHGVAGKARSIFVLWVQHQVIRQSVNDKIMVVRSWNYFCTKP